MADHLALQASQDELNAEDHQKDPDEEQRLVMNLLTIKDAATYDKNIYQDAKEKCPETERAKEPQGSTQKRREEEDIEQIDQAASEATGTEFGDAVFTRMVANLDLRDAKATPLGHNWHKAMKFTIEFEVCILNNFAAIGFEAVVDVVKVNAGEGADHAVKDARWKCF